MNTHLVQQAKRAARKADIHISNAQLRRLSTQQLYRLIRHASRKQKIMAAQITPEQLEQGEAAIRAMFRTPEGIAAAEAVLLTIGAPRDPE